MVQEASLFCCVGGTLDQILSFAFRGELRYCFSFILDVVIVSLWFPFPSHLLLNVACFIFAGLFLSVTLLFLFVDDFVALTVFFGFRLTYRLWKSSVRRSQDLMYATCVGFMCIAFGSLASLLDDFFESHRACDLGRKDFGVLLVCITQISLTIRDYAIGITPLHFFGHVKSHVLTLFRVDGERLW